MLGFGILDRIRAMRPKVFGQDITEEWTKGIDMAGVDPGTFGTKPQPRAIDVLREGEFKSIE